MPMPEAGPNFFSPASPTNPQPQLLEQRKSWVKKDRDVKLDIFLSVSDDIKLEVFDVGPPLPPVSLTAKDMMELMDDRFAEFKFEDYHHVFCHFLNLHVDQYNTIEDFNAEYQATLNDLLDHGHPMSNVQACSAYFSKMRCTQNPWVLRKLKEWDGLELEPQLEHLMQQSPPWSVVKPVSGHGKPSSSHHSLPDSIPEEHLEDTPHHSDGEYTPSEHSVSSSASSRSSHYSQKTYQTYQHSRDISIQTTRSQEITIHASYDDITDLSSFPMAPISMTPYTNIPKRGSSMANLASLPAPPPINRPLPPLPPNASPAPSERSDSPQPSITKSIESGKSVKKVQLPILPSYTYTGNNESIHPALRSTTPRSVPEENQSQADIHPAFRSASPALSTPGTPPRTVETILTVPSPSNHETSSAQSPPIAMSPNMASPRFSAVMSLFPAPLSSKRPTSSRSALHPAPLRTTPSPAPTSAEDLTLHSPPGFHVSSANSSTMSLPLQGTPSPDRMDGPEFKDSLITEAGRYSGAATPPLPPLSAANVSMSKMEKARMKFEGGVGVNARAGSPPRALNSPALSHLSEDEKKNRKRSWNIKAKLSARHGIKEII